MVGGKEGQDGCKRRFVEIKKVEKKAARSRFTKGRQEEHGGLCACSGKVEGT